MGRDPDIRIGDRVYRKNPAVDRYQIHVEELEDFRMMDMPPHSTLEVLGLPEPRGASDLECTAVNGGSEGTYEFLSLYGGASFNVALDERTRIIARLRRAFSLMDPDEDRPMRNPEISARIVDGGIRAHVYLSFNFEHSPATRLRDALLPFIHGYQRLDRPSVHVFICHASEDKPAARALAEAMTKLGAEVWFDEWEIKVGESIVQKISDALGVVSHLIVLLSQSSVEKPWVRKEFSAALMRQLSQQSITVLPIRLDDCRIPPILADIKYADARQGMKHALTALEHALFSTSDASMGSLKTADAVTSPRGHLIDLVRGELEFCRDQSTHLCEYQPGAGRRGIDTMHIPANVSSGSGQESWETVRQRLNLPAAASAHAADESPPRSNLLILGDSGAGKTWIAVRESADRNQFMLDHLGDFPRKEDFQFAVYVRAAALQPGKSLVEAVMTVLSIRHEKIWNETLGEIVEEKIGNGDCLLVLDALDEAADRNGLCKALRAFLFAGQETEYDAKHAGRLLLTSRRIGYHQYASLECAEYLLQPFGPQQVESAIARWLADCPEAATCVRELVRSGSPWTAGAMVSPIHLMMTCYIARDSMNRSTIGLRPSTTLYGLYHEFGNVIFARWRERGGPSKYEGDIQELNFRRLLSELALHLMEIEAGNESTDLEQMPATHAFGEAILRVEASARDQSFVSWMRGPDRDLFKELCDSGLLLGEGRFGHRWWHPSLQAYFAAVALGTVMEVTSASEIDRLWNVVDALAWSPLRKGTVIFLAGRLSCGRVHLARQLLSRLGDPSRDDLFAHRLIVAAMCLPALEPQSWPALANEIDTITTLCTWLWAWANSYSEFHYFHLLDLAFSGLAVTNGVLRLQLKNSLMLSRLHPAQPEEPEKLQWTDGARFLDWVAWLPLAADGSIGRWDALSVLFLIGHRALTTKVLENLAIALKTRPGGGKSGEDFRLRALKVVFNLPALHCQTPILNAFAREIGSGDLDTRCVFIWMLSQLKLEAADSGVTAALWSSVEGCIAFDNSWVRCLAIRVLAQMAFNGLGAVSAARDRFVEVWLHEGDESTRRTALSSIVNLSGAADAIDLLTQRSAGFHEFPVVESGDESRLDRHMTPKVRALIQQLSDSPEDLSVPLDYRSWSYPSGVPADHFRWEFYVTHDIPKLRGTRFGMVQTWTLRPSHDFTGFRRFKLGLEWLKWEMRCTYRRDEVWGDPDDLEKALPEEVNRFIGAGFAKSVLHILGRRILELVVMRDYRIFIRLDGEERISLSGCEIRPLSELVKIGAART